MKCPLTYSGMTRGGSYDIPIVFDCLKEECAWWDETYNRCSILTLAFIFNDLRDIIANISGKMPHAGQFTK